MSKRKEALQDLRPKVEAGDGDITFREFDACFSRDAFNAMTAYNGSQDAVQALHESVLDGYRWSLYEEDDGTFLCIVSLISNGKIYEEEWAKTPSMARLKAIIKALIAQEGE